MSDRVSETDKRENHVFVREVDGPVVESMPLVRKTPEEIERLRARMEAAGQKGYLDRLDKKLKAEEG